MINEGFTILSRRIFRLTIRRLSGIPRGMMRMLLFRLLRICIAGQADEVLCIRCISLMIVGQLRRFHRLVSSVDIMGMYLACTSHSHIRRYRVFSQHTELTLANTCVICSGASQLVPRMTWLVGLVAAVALGGLRVVMW
jgi:hypothetical protein